MNIVHLITRTGYMKGNARGGKTKFDTDFCTFSGNATSNAVPLHSVELFPIDMEDETN